MAELGCEFALDDFGAGFASFYYLKHLAFDLLKIDGEFVTDLTTSRTNQLVVKAVVDIARGLGKRTIAEFVEDAETLELLRGMGVDFAQGFYVAKPAPLPSSRRRSTSRERLAAGSRALVDRAAELRGHERARPAAALDGVGQRVRDQLAGQALAARLGHHRDHLHLGVGARVGRRAAAAGAPSWWAT